jgi:hypothetical protein
MAQLLRFSGVAFGLLVGCQAEATPPLQRAATGVLFREAHAAEPSPLTPTCKLELPLFRTLVLRGSDCASRRLHQCTSGRSARALQSELHSLVERCHAQESALRVGVTFRAGCAEQVRLSAEIPTESLRCLADALNAERLSCAEAVPCSLSEAPTLARN